MQDLRQLRGVRQHLAERVARQRSDEELRFDPGEHPTVHPLAVLGVEMVYQELREQLPGPIVEVFVDARQHRERVVAASLELPLQPFHVPGFQPFLEGLGRELRGAEGREQLDNLSPECLGLRFTPLQQRMHDLRTEEHDNGEGDQLEHGVESPERNGHHQFARIPPRHAFQAALRRGDVGQRSSPCQDSAID